MPASALRVRAPAPAVEVDPAGVVMVGIDHVAAPLAVRERLAAACADLPSLAGLFHHALSVGKKARAQTGISRGAASIGSAAAAILREELLVGGAAGLGHVVVVGAGEAAERVLANLRPLGVVRIDVANRT